MVIATSAFDTKAVLMTTMLFLGFRYGHTYVVVFNAEADYRKDKVVRLTLYQLVFHISTHVMYGNLFLQSLLSQQIPARHLEFGLFFNAVMIPELQSFKACVQERVSFQCILIRHVCSSCSSGSGVFPLQRTDLMLHSMFLTVIPGKGGDRRLSTTR